MSTIQDMWDSVKEQVQDLGYTISSYLPSGSAVPIISAVAIIISGISCAVTFGSMGTARKLESNAMQYKAGQQQLNSVLGSKEEIAFSDDSEEVIGRTNLVLQYATLSELPSDSNLTRMEKQLGVDDDAVEQENDNYDETMIDQITDFAGDYGGVLISAGSTASSNIQIAAYSAENQMKKQDNTSNVLYEKIDRKIAGSKYGEKSTSNSLVILSANSLSGLSSVKTGSVMYSMFGTSEGSKTRGKYVCTGFEYGSAEEDLDDEDLEDEEIEGEELTGRDTNAEDTDVEAKDDEEVEASVMPQTDGNGVVVITDDDEAYSGGSYNSDGSVNDEWIKNNSSNSDSDDEDNDYSTSIDEDDEDEMSTSYSDEDDLGYTSKNSSAATTVYSKDGTALSDNTTADLILYTYNKKTGKVFITYWNFADSDAAKSVLASESTN